MKAPDKIYIQPNAHDGWFDGEKPSDIFEEYIRKDALLEWAREELENAELTDFDEFGSGEVIAWKHVLDKLNSI